MKQFVRKIFVMMLGFWGISCISFRIDPLIPPENIVTNVTLCKSIDEDREILKPSDSTSEFDSTTENIICFIELIHITQKMTFQWKWYSPNLELFKVSAEITVNDREEYIENITAYDMLEYSAVEHLPGEWIVIVLTNDELLARRSFVVKSLLCITE